MLKSKVGSNFFLVGVDSGGSSSDSLVSSARFRLLLLVLGLVGMEDKGTWMPEQLSGGQKQRLSIARALLNEPQLIIADEPTGNLHTKQGEQIMDLFKELNDEGVTIIQVTHSEKNAQYGSRIIELEDGFIKNDQLL